MSGLEWHIGDHVRVRGEPWTIRETDVWPDCITLRLGRERGTAAGRALLAPFDRPIRLDQTHRITSVRGRRWSRQLRRTAADMVPYGGARVAALSSVTLLPHQIEPLLAVLRHGATRLLIADAVGLGKTIQAGLMLGELAAQDDEFRAMIILPAGLREQWAGELLDRFGLTTRQADAAWLRQSSAQLPVDVNPWSLPGIYIASIDFAKRPEVLRALEDLFWDLLILDEAHLASASSDRRAAAHAVASRARRAVLLTATPDTGNPAAFATLCAIGALSPSDNQILFFRRTRAEVGGGQLRRSVFVRVQPTAAELRMHDLLGRYTQAVWTESGLRSDTRARLSTIVLRKRALSSAASLAVSALRRLDLLSGVCEPRERQLLLPLADQDDATDDVGDEELAAPGLSDGRKERGWLAAIAEAARHAARAESKLTRLLRWLARVGEPVLIFTEYRDTLHRLERLIRASGRSIVTLHGGLDRAERSRVQTAFNAGGLSLLATDAAAEGLNLHHHCRVVVHYELPWRPARIEQRAGRVDRLGQTRRVHEIALVAAGTAERLVLAPLAVRAARSRAAGGATAGLLDSLSESMISELVMDGVLPSRAAPQMAAAPTMIRTLDLRDEATQEVARLDAARRCRTPAPTRLRRGERDTDVRVTTIRASRTGREPGILLVFEQHLSDADGRRVHAEPCVLFLSAPALREARPSPAALRRLIEELRTVSMRPGSIIHQRLAQELSAASTSIWALHAVAQQLHRKREEALRHSQLSAARHLVQAGLFDRRSVRGMQQRGRDRAARLQESDALLDTLTRADSLIPGTELVQAMVVAGASS